MSKLRQEFYLVFWNSVITEFRELLLNICIYWPSARLGFGVVGLPVFGHGEIEVIVIIRYSAAIMESKGAADGAHRALGIYRYYTESQFWCRLRLGWADLLVA